MDIITRKQIKIFNQSFDFNYFIGLIVGLIIFIPCLIFGLQHQLTGFEKSVFLYINGWPNFLKEPAVLITNGLGASYPIALCVLIPIAFKRYKLAWRFFFVVGLAGVVMEVIKRVVLEPRPYILLHNHLNNRSLSTGDYSFPSGHVVVATALALVLWLILPKKWRFISIIWILLVAISRVYLGAHSPVDVIAGFSVGLIIFSIVELLPTKLAKKLYLDDDASLLNKTKNK
jgi:membrane-associated phospholipid phosphatase